MPTSWITRRNGKYLEIFHLQRLNHKETEYLNRPITDDKIELVIKSLQHRKAQGLFCCFTKEFYQTFKELLAILQILPKIVEEGTLLNSLLRLTFPYTKSRKGYYKETTSQYS